MSNIQDAQKNDSMNEISILKARIAAYNDANQSLNKSGINTS